MPAADTSLRTPYGVFELTRYPTRPVEPLQAWCAADILLLEEVHGRGVTGVDLLVVNDTHGTLCVALQPQALWTDSALAAQSLKHNQGVNERHPTPVFWSTQTPASTPQVVVLRIPKQLPFF